MDKQNLRLADAIFSIITFLITFFLNLFLQDLFDTRTLIPMLFVLGVFLVSLKTQGYFWGISVSLVSVLAVNYAFTYPYYAFDLISPECVFSAVVMLIVAILTGMLTTQLKVQEKINAEIDKERMRTNLLRAVSHDLRTPLTSIYGSSSLMLENDGQLSKDQKKQLLSEMRDDAQWLIRMVENLLSVTRLDGGNMQLVKQPGVLEEMIDHVVIKFRKHYPMCAVQVEIPEDFVLIPMDAVLIQQVLLNLLENAAHHAAGMTKLTLRVECRENRAYFTVEDNGCGIPAEKLKDLFSGITESGSRPVDGTRHNMGIGLSVCAAIIKAHGSEITASSTPGVGTQVTFWLEMEALDE